MSCTGQRGFLHVKPAVTEPLWRLPVVQPSRGFLAAQESPQVYTFQTLSVGKGRTVGTGDRRVPLSRSYRGRRDHRPLEGCLRPLK